jgi:hypothetical protein
MTVTSYGRKNLGFWQTQQDDGSSKTGTRTDDNDEHLGG